MYHLFTPLLAAVDVAGAIVVVANVNIIVVVAIVLSTTLETSCRRKNLATYRFSIVLLFQTKTFSNFAIDKCVGEKKRKYKLWKRLKQFQNLNTGFRQCWYFVVLLLYWGAKL